MPLGGKNLTLWRGLGLAIFVVGALILLSAEQAGSFLAGFGAIAIMSFGMTLALRSRKVVDG